MKNHIPQIAGGTLLLIALISNSSEKNNPIPDTQLGSNTPYLTDGQRAQLNERRGMGSDAGIRAVGGLETMMYTENFIQRMAASTSSAYTNMSPSIQSAVENTVKVGVGATASYVGYKVGRPIYNYFRPSLEDRIKKEENMKKLYDLQQERLVREKEQRKYALVNELSKCAYENSKHYELDRFGIPEGCNATTFSLVMYHQDGFNHMCEIGRKIKLLRGEKLDGQ